MNLYDIIEKKRQGLPLSGEEISFFVNGVTDGSVEDYKAASLLMAIAVNGMTAEETFDLTMAMLNSGAAVDLSGVTGVPVDKHSTGGVSDSTSLIVSPILACLGVKMAKMSGRGLGHTGGTIDKLESFAGYDAEMSLDKFIDTVNAVGACITGQTEELVPADKKLYQLRDLTATVRSLPLIASSIMSKKLATGVPHILLDVKYGGGAFMKEPKEAVRLAKCMVDIGTRAGKNVQAMVTRMTEPLGSNIGCNLEVREAIEVLRGKEGDLKELSCAIAARLAVMAGVCETREEALGRVNDAVADGSALEKFKEMIVSGGGSTAAFEDLDELSKAPVSDTVKCVSGGVVTSIDAEKLGKAVAALGGGRMQKTDGVDHTVGIEMLVRVSSEVEPESEIAVVYANTEEALAAAKEAVAAAVTIGGEQRYEPLVYALIKRDETKYDAEIEKLNIVEDAVMDYEQNLSREAEEFKYKSVVEKIEHTLLSQTATPDKIKKLCDEASEYHFATVCVMPTQVADAVKYLGENSVRVCTVIGYPYGEDVTAVKVAAAKAAVKAGAGEIDMVMCISKAKQGNWKYVTKEIAKVVKAARKHTVKVIIETSLLTDEEIRKATHAVVAAKADYVKTSTGLFGGATMDAVKTIKSELDKTKAQQTTFTVGIKASGGIKSKNDAYVMLNAGATRIGTSNGIAIADEIKRDVEKVKEEIGKPGENI